MYHLSQNPYYVEYVYVTIPRIICYTMTEFSQTIVLREMKQKLECLQITRFLLNI